MCIYIYIYIYIIYDKSGVPPLVIDLPVEAHDQPDARILSLFDYVY